MTEAPSRCRKGSCRCSRRARRLWARVAAARRITYGSSGWQWRRGGRRNMKTKLCEVDPGALDKRPKFTDDKSGIGVHYVDAYIKPINTKLPDGTVVRCKRRGLKLT